MDYILYTLAVITLVLLLKYNRKAIIPLLLIAAGFSIFVHLAFDVTMTKARTQDYLNTGVIIILSIGTIALVSKFLKQRSPMKKGVDAKNEEVKK